MLWECDGCGTTRECDPLAGDDWGGVQRAIGPDCGECGGIPMRLVEEFTTCIECGLHHTGPCPPPVPPADGRGEPGREAYLTGEIPSPEPSE